jgi:hypothetical protein
MAVNGLRSEMSLDSEYGTIPSTSGSSGGSSGGALGEQSNATTMRVLRKALKISKDDGHTLDMSRDQVEGIGDEAVEMLANGVGRHKEGVWR